MDIKHLRILHTSDLHLGEETYGCDRLEALVEAATGINVHLVIVAGDLFESNRVSDNAVSFILQQLYRFQVPVILLPGNHDCLVNDSIYRRESFSKPVDSIQVFKDLNGETFSFPELDAAVWGRPLGDYAGDLHPLAGIPPRSSERWQIAVVHGWFADISPSLKRFSFPITEEEVDNCGRDYVALGHCPTFTCVSDARIKAYYSGSATQTGTFAVVDFLDGMGVKVTPYYIP